ncbi:MAG: hypothetical protein RL336_642 [Pseudomonadota bacterium]
MKKFHILCAAMGCSLGLAANAQDLEEIFVTAPLHGDGDSLAIPVNHLSGDELQDKLASTLGATLQQEPGVTFASFGGGVGQPIIRGQGAPRVLVLQNSLAVSDAANTSGDHANGIEPILAHDIEVLRGPATLLFGGGAIGGVVNVIDNSIASAVPESLEGAIETRMDSNAHTRSTTARVSAGVNNTAIYLSGFNRNSDDIRLPGTADIDGDGPIGVLENSAAKASGGTLGISRVFDQGYIGVSFNKLANNYGIPPGAHAHEESPDEEEVFVRIDLEQTRNELRGEFRFDEGFFNRARLWLADTAYQHTEFEGAESGTVFESSTQDVRFDLSHSDDAHRKGVVGMQWQKNDFSALGAEAFLPATQSKAAGVFAIESISGDIGTVEFGGRVSWDQHTSATQVKKSFTSTSVSSSLLLPIAEAQAFSVAIAYAQRAPSREELFSNGVHVATGSYELGDENLGTESSTNLDLGFEIEADGYFVNLSAFYNRMRDFVNIVKTGEVFNTVSEQFELGCTAVHEADCLAVRQWTASQANFYGAEIELTYTLSDAWSIKIFGDTVRAAFANGDDVPRIPASRLGVASMWQRGPWDAELSWIEVFKQARVGVNEAPVDGYTQLSAHLNYTTELESGELQWFVRGQNLLDEDIRLATSLLRNTAPEPGVNIETGIRFYF